MKYSIGIKILALLLAALALTTAAFSLLGIALSIDHDFYDSLSWKQWESERQTNTAQLLAEEVAYFYATNQCEGVSNTLLYHLYGYHPDLTELSLWQDLNQSSWYFRIESNDGKLLDTNTPEPAGDQACTFPVQIPTVLPATQDTEGALRFDHGTSFEYYRLITDQPPYQVTIWFDADCFTEYSGTPIRMLQSAFALRDSFFWIILASLGCFALCLVFLFFAAGRKAPAVPPAPAGLNRMPLDLYFAVAAGAVFGLGALTVFCLDASMRIDPPLQTWLLILSVAGMFLACLCVIGWLFALAAQVKGNNRYWWHASLIGKLCKLVCRCLRFLWKLTVRFFRMLPFTWQWLLTAVLMLFFPAVFVLFCGLSVGFGEVFWALMAIGALAADIAIVCYGAYCFGLLYKGTRQMAAGDLNTRIPDKFLFLSFADFANALNALGSVTNAAARQKLHAERMKTELITNVSHDIKTPLTSIINYVDLLGSAQTAEERAQYLEVLSRQSQQMKRLLEDLLEMSKASTGNLSVELTELDIEETIKQALGEYADRLEQAGLTVVLRPPETPLILRADGRLTWRVLSNLLSNVVKYAMPGTRVYLELSRSTGHGLLSLKNISREELNVPAEELMERFVRGDTSRNSDGSGLGLNIAQSLMEAQGGRLQLYVDGDLFKVTLTLPEAAPGESGGQYPVGKADS